MPKGAISLSAPRKATLGSSASSIATSMEEMNERNRADDLDRILSERLKEVPATYPNRPWGALHRAMRSIRTRLGGKPDVLPTAPWQWEIIARIRSLPPHLQEPLRRYFVFREAEASICFSIDTTPREFRGKEHRTTGILHGERSGRACPAAAMIG
jgi:hypothetical protein